MISSAKHAIRTIDHLIHPQTKTNKQNLAQTNVSPSSHSISTNPSDQQHNKTTLSPITTTPPTTTTSTTTTTTSTTTTTTTTTLAPNTTTPPTPPPPPDTNWKCGGYMPYVDQSNHQFDNSYEITKMGFFHTKFSAVGK